jgi:hypothetical protein
MFFASLFFGMFPNHINHGLEREREGGGGRVLLFFVSSLSLFQYVMFQELTLSLAR